MANTLKKYSSEGGITVQRSGVYVARSESFTVTRTVDSAAKTNNTLAKDDTLKFTVTGNSTAIYSVEALLLVSAANATMDAKFGWDGPTGGTASWGLGSGILGAGFSANSTASLIVAVLAIGGTQAVGTLNGTSGAYLAGMFFEGGTAGNFTLRWAQNTTDAGNLVLLKGSFLRVRRLVD